MAKIEVTPVCSKMIKYHQNGFVWSTSYLRIIWRVLSVWKFIVFELFLVDWFGYPKTPKNEGFCKVLPLSIKLRFLQSSPLINIFLGNEWGRTLKMSLYRGRTLKKGVFSNKTPFGGGCLSFFPATFEKHQAYHWKARVLMVTPIGFVFTGEL